MTHFWATAALHHKCNYLSRVFFPLKADKQFIYLDIFLSNQQELTSLNSSSRMSYLSGKDCYRISALPIRNNIFTETKSCKKIKAANISFCQFHRLKKTWLCSDGTGASQSSCTFVTLGKQTLHSIFIEKLEERGESSGWFTFAEP